MVELDIKFMMSQNLLFGGKLAIRSTRDFVEVNIPHFITKDNRATISPDLNPLDYSIRDYFKKFVYVQENNVRNVPSLRIVIVSGW